MFFDIGSQDRISRPQVLIRPYSRNLWDPGELYYMDWTVTPLVATPKRHSVVPPICLPGTSSFVKLFFNNVKY